MIVGLKNETGLIYVGWSSSHNPPGTPGGGGFILFEQQVQARDGRPDDEGGRLHIHHEQKLPINHLKRRGRLCANLS